MAARQLGRCPICYTRTLLAFVVFSFLASYNVAQTTNSPAAPQALAVLQGASRTLSGRTTINDVTLTGTARQIAGSDDETGTATLKATASGDSRVDLSFRSDQHSEIRNHAGTPRPGTQPQDLPAGGTQATQTLGVWYGQDGVSHPIAGHNLVTDSAWFFPALVLSRFGNTQNYVISSFSNESRDGVPVEHLTVIQQFPGLPAQLAALPQHLSQIDVFLNPSTLLPVAFVFNVHPDDNGLIDIPVEIRFSDYRPTNGVQVPFHVQEYMNGTLALDLQFQSVVVNSGISATEFAVQ